MISDSKLLVILTTLVSLGVKVDGQVTCSIGASVTNCNSGSILVTNGGASFCARVITNVPLMGLASACSSPETLLSTSDFASNKFTTTVACSDKLTDGPYAVNAYQKTAKTGSSGSVWTDLKGGPLTSTNTTVGPVTIPTSGAGCPSSSILTFTPQSKFECSKVSLGTIATKTFSVICISATTATPVIDGGWSIATSKCSGECGSTSGINVDTRICNNPKKSDTGKDCTKTPAAGTDYSNDAAGLLVEKKTTIPSCTVPDCKRLGVVVGGSYKQSELFVPGQVCQKNLADLPFGFVLPIVVVYNGFLFVCGNPSFALTCYKYIKATATATESWVKYASTTSDHTNNPGVLLDSKLYLYGDRNGEILDMANPTSPPTDWEKAPIATTGKACLVVVSKKIYLIGGATAKAIQVYDPAISVGSKWSKAADLPSSSYNMGCSVMSGGNSKKIMITTFGTANNNVVIFDTEAKTFQNVPIANVDVYSSNVILFGADNYLVCGGQSGSNKIWKFSITASNPDGTIKTWSWTVDPTVVLLTSRSLSTTAIIDASFFEANFLSNQCTGA